MLTKLSLLAAVGQAVTVGVTAGTGPTNYILAVTPSTGGSSKDYANNGYACVRRNWVYAYPMTTTANDAYTVPNTTVSNII